MPYNKLFINLVSRSVQRNIVPRSFLYRHHPTGSVCAKETSFRYFSVQTSRSVNKKLLFLPNLEYCRIIILAWHFISADLQNIWQFNLYVLPSFQNFQIFKGNTPLPPFIATSFLFSSTPIRSTSTTWAHWISAGLTLTLFFHRSHDGFKWYH